MGTQLACAVSHRRPADPCCPLRRWVLLWSVRCCTTTASARTRTSSGCRRRVGGAALLGLRAQAILPAARSPRD